MESGFWVDRLESSHLLPWVQRSSLARAHPCVLCRQELQFRCAMMVKAALEAPWIVPVGPGPELEPLGEENLVFVANDWHAALLPFYLQAHYRDHGQYTYARAMFIIHNMAHQGRGPMADLDYLEVSGRLAVDGDSFRAGLQMPTLCRD